MTISTGKMKCLYTTLRATLPQYLQSCVMCSLCVLCACHAYLHEFYYLQFRGDGGIPWHRLGWQIIVAVRAVEEGLSPLVMAREVSVEDQTRARGRLRIQGAAAGRCAILHVKTENRKKDILQDAVFLFFFTEAGRWSAIKQEKNNNTVT